MSGNNEYLQWRTLTDHDEREDLATKIEDNPLESPEDAKKLLRDILVAGVRGSIPPTQLEAVMPIVQAVAVQPFAKKDSIEGGSFSMRVTQERIDLAIETRSAAQVSSRMNGIRSQIEEKRSREMPLKVIEGELAEK
jgi:hypothetical protein